MDMKKAFLLLANVGLPLAEEFAKKYPTIGFEINTNKVDPLISSHDYTLEVEDADFHQEIASDQMRAESKVRGLYCAIDVGDIESAMLSRYQLKYKRISPKSTYKSLRNCG